MSDSKYVSSHHEAMIKNINWNIKHLKELHPDYSMGGISDCYHTFNELYDHRAKLFAALCKAYPGKAWKSLKHHDEETDPMYEGMFIVCLETPAGPVHYHYDIDPYWELFKDVPEYDRAKPYDGASPAEEIERLTSL